jgi:hypothetical protein
MSGQSTDSTAGLGIGVVQPQSGLDYPFIAPGAGADTKILADVEGLFADFYLSYDDPGYYKTTPKIQHPLRVYWLYGFDDGPAFSTGGQPIPGVQKPAPTHDVDLLVLDAQNKVVFDSTAADKFTETTWGQHYKIYEWIKTTKPNEAVCRAVIYTALHTNESLPQRPVEFFPRNAVLDERAVEKIPKRVLAMRVKNGDCVTPWFKNKVTFVNGFNTEIQVGALNELATQFDINAGFGLFAADALRQITEIAFSADAGSGFGQFGLCATQTDNCAETRPTNVCPPEDDIILGTCFDNDGEEIKSINGVTPDENGNILINADGCLYARQPTPYVNGQPNPTPAHVEIGADCGQCCACDDYVDVAKYLNVVADRYRAIGDRVAETKAVHEQNVSRWVAQRDCRIQRPLRLFIVPQPCPCVDVVLMYCNQCETCVENVLLTVRLSTTPAGGSGRLYLDYSQVVSENESVQPTVYGGWPVFSVPFNRVQPGQSVYAKLRICFCPEYPYTLNATLTGVQANGPILAGCDPSAGPASAVAVQTLDC